MDNQNQNNSEILLSIIIPTHNRSQYAISCIKSILLYTHGSYEIIVHDTSTTDELMNYAASVADDRLNYIRCYEHLSMTDNHNRAFTYSKGEYLILIGDDDTINPKIMDLCQYAVKNNIEALSQNICSNYVWPDFKSKRMGSRHAARLYFNRSITAQIQKIDCNQALTKTLEHSCQGADFLPKIYHGLVKKSVYDKIIADHGVFFFGTSPDISGALVVAEYIKNYYEIDYPLSIPGASGGSNTGRAALNKHKGTLEEDSHTKRFKHINWNPLIPKFVSPETIWTQASIETFEHINKTRIEQFNWYRLYAYCLINHRDYLKETTYSLSIFFKNKGFISKLSLAYEIIKVSFEKFFRLVKRLSLPTAAGYRKYIDHITEVKGVPENLNNYLDKNKINHFLNQNLN
ncbi:MAG: glycosyltransferase family 2 protein [Pseudobdellovibrio sp.]